MPKIFKFSRKMAIFREILKFYELIFKAENQLQFHPKSGKKQGFYST